MAVQSFDEVMAGLQLSAEERKLFDKTLSSNPTLRDGWLRQDDYSRKQTELRTRETDMETKRAAFEAQRDVHEAWAEKAVPTWERLKEKGIVDDDGNELWSTKEAEYQRQLEAARLSGADMKPEDVRAEVERIVKEAGGATKAEVEALMQSKMKEAASAAFADEWGKKETKFNEETIPFVAGFSSAAAIVSTHYERETGEKWSAEKQKEMYALMNAKKNFDPFAVEEDMLKPFRDKKKIDDEVERRVKEQVQSRRAEQGGYDDDIPQRQEKGALQRMLEESGKENGGVGDSGGLIAQKAREAAAALRAEGKG